MVGPGNDSSHDIASFWFQSLGIVKKILEPDLRRVVVCHYARMALINW
jgi:hypothetical protein